MNKEEIFQKLSDMLSDRCTPENITTLQPNEVFVFGSKPNGEHKSGAAKTALEKYGAVEGKAEGMSGQSYAIPVHRHRTEKMAEAVGRFVEYARVHPELTFYVLPIGCGNANMDVAIVAKMFMDAIDSENVYLPDVFIKALKKDIIIPKDEQLPIVYVDEIINADCLRGRMLGLMAEISKRTEQPITFDDDILKKENVLLFAFLRIAKVVKKEEQRVLNALMDEAKRMSETGLGKESDNETIRVLEFVRGWKLEANKIFEDGGSMYDLLNFTKPQYVQNTCEKICKNGSHEKLENGKLAIFNDNGRFGLKSNEEIVLIPAEYEEIKGAGWSGRGWLLKKEGKWGAVNERGEWMFDVEYDEIKTRYEGGHFLRKNGKMGFCNSEGLVTIDFLYDELENYSSSWDGAKAKIDDKWGYVDGKGNVVVPIEYTYVDLDVNGMIKVKKDGKYGFYDVRKGLAVPIEYDQAYGFTSSHPNETVVERGKTWGVITTQGEIILPFEYERISIDSSGVYRVKKAGLVGIIDREGKNLFPFKYKDLGAFDKNGVAYAQNLAGLYGYIDKDDNLLIPFSYQNAKDFDGNYAEVSLGWNQNGVIDKNGKVVVPLRYNFICISWDDFVEVEKDDRENCRNLRGLYDLRNGNILPCIYERISPRGRNREGILECECWKDRRGEPEMVKVKAVNDGQTITVQQDVIYYILLNLLNNGQYEISDIRKEDDVSNRSWQKTNVYNYNGQLEEVEVSNEGNGCLWIKKKCTNHMLYLPKSVGSEEIVGFSSSGCQTADYSLKGIVVPEGYKYIGAEAFMAHPSLELVSLPDGMRRIERSAFCKCPNLKHVFLGTSGPSLFLFGHPFSILDNMAFNDCHPSLTFYIPDRFNGRLYDRSRFAHVESRELNERKIVSEYMMKGLVVNVNNRSKIAIARDFAVVLNENEWQLDLIGFNPDFRQLCRTTRRKFVKLAAGFDGYMALANDGRIYVGPRAREFECGAEIEQLRDVIDIVGCEGHTVALHGNGSITCIDEPASYEGPKAFAREVESWEGIRQVACGFDFVAGLKSDGSLISVGRYYHCPDWQGITQFDAFNCYYGQIYTIALLADGRVVSDFTDEVSAWRNVVRVRMGNNGYAVGLKADGTTYALGDEDFVRKVQSWRNVVEIECKFNKAVAILSDGEIVTCGFY